MFLTSYALHNLKLFKFKTEGQYKQKTSPKSDETEIKVLDNSGLALSAFEQLGPSDLMLLFT